MGKALMRKLIEAQVKMLRHPGNVAQISLKVAAGKNLQHLLRERLQVLVALLSQIPAGELVIPVRSRKLLDRALIDGLFFRAELIALQENGKLLVESGVI